MNMDVISANYQSVVDKTITDKAKKEIKEMEERCCSRAETLDDIKGDTTGKTFRTADIERLMEKYDPEAYAHYSKIAKGSDGARTLSGLTYLSRWQDNVKKGLVDGSNGTTDANEAKLSSKAQDFLKKLRKQYGDYDFFVGNKNDDLKSLVKSGSKEFSIIFSSEELERMASDEEYANKKLQEMEQAVKMSEEINKKYGFGQNAGKNGGADITKMGIVFNDDGTTSFFAELEKSSAKQREHLDKVREEKRAAKKEEAKKAEKEIGKYAKNKADTKRASVEADSIEELLKKISAVDWDDVKAEKVPVSGGKYDFSI